MNYKESKNKKDDIAYCPCMRSAKMIKNKKYVNDLEINKGNKKLK